MTHSISIRGSISFLPTILLRYARNRLRLDRTDSEREKLAITVTTRMPEIRAIKVAVGAAQAMEVILTGDLIPFR